MPRNPNGRILLLFVGDLIAFYASLLLALLIRGGGTLQVETIEVHLMPFSMIFLGFLLCLYLAGLYDIRRFRGGIDLLKTVALALSIGAIIAIVFFYFVPDLGIAPKTSLFLFLVCFGIIELVWRRTHALILLRQEPPYRVLLLGDTNTAREIAATLKASPQLGYTLAEWVKNEGDGINLSGRLRADKANVVIVPRHLRQDSRFARELYELFAQGIVVRDIPSFYETLFKKVPLADLEETWFLENLTDHQRFYDQLKRAGEFVLALLLLVVLAPLWILIAFLVLVTSRGPILYRQIRIGERGRAFCFYKFRNMYHDQKRNPDADGSKPMWTVPNDPRITPLGRILRKTHLDEIPQLLHVLWGELSFIGPRPERPELIEMLRTQIPHYDLRHLVKPGITGWAQINYPYGASVEDAARKLEYDIYYLKNRSLVLDLAIGLRTLKSLFVSPRK